MRPFLSRPTVVLVFKLPSGSLTVKICSHHLRNLWQGEQRSFVSNRVGKYKRIIIPCNHPRLDLCEWHRPFHQVLQDLAEDRPKCVWKHRLRRVRFRFGRLRQWKNTVSSGLAGGAHPHRVTGRKQGPERMNEFVAIKHINSRTDMSGVHHLTPYLKWQN